MQPLKSFLVFLFCLFLYGENVLPQTKSSQPLTENQSTGSGEKHVDVELSEMDWDAEENEDSGTSPASDLQNINWDQEDPEEAAVEDATPGTLDETSTSDLQSINWDDEGSADESADFIQPPPSREAREELSEGRILFIHWSGAILFLLYVSGSLGSGYFLRNSTLSARFPPDILIVLHTFWPLEWAMLPFFRQKKDVDE